MANGLSYEKMLQECLKSEFKVVNAHLPGRQKALSELLDEEYPHVLCRDGSSHLFKRKELEYLSGLLTEDERKRLLLPMLIEVSAAEDEMSLICQGGVEEKVISSVLDMTVTSRGKRVVIYKPQLAEIRKRLRTTTQYLFVPKV